MTVWWSKARRELRGGTFHSNEEISITQDQGRFKENKKGIDTN
jgi:hypothetical protein